MNEVLYPKWMCACMLVSTFATPCCVETVFCNFCIHLKSLWMSKLNQPQTLMLIRGIMLMPLPIRTLQVCRNRIDTRFKLNVILQLFYTISCIIRSMQNILNHRVLPIMDYMDYYQSSEHAWFLLVIFFFPCSELLLLCLIWYDFLFKKVTRILKMLI